MVVKKIAQNEAIKMLLNGATLSSDPCPYCNGVRVVKKGYALCIQCGQKPNIQKYNKQSQNTQNEKAKNLYKSETMNLILKQKLRESFNDLESEKDYEAQHKILRVIDNIIDILSKLKQ